MIVGNHNESDRKAWLQKALSVIPSGSSILDAGAGQLENKTFCSHLVYTSQDFCQYSGDGDKRALQTGIWETKNIDIVSDITAIPLADASFDAILCSEVLEHVPSPEAALKEITRLLKLNGTLVLTAPFCSLTHFSPYHFASGFNHYYYDYHLKKLGFEIVAIDANGNYFEYMAQEIRRLPEMAKLYANFKTGIFSKILARCILLLLQHLSSRDTKSQEVLCFGYGVVARKIQP